MFNIGKTLVCKEKALRKSLEDCQSKVYYISLVSSTRYGAPKVKRHVFDICTKEYDFKNSDVVALDIQDLVRDYNKNKNPNEWCSLKGNFSIYKLVLNFIRNNPKAHYIFDEVPLGKGNITGMKELNYHYLI